jgi:L-threonylcarbamoyladenylate synthase
MGLAAAARHEGAVARMREMKGSAGDRPFIVLIDEPARIDGLIHSMQRYVVDYIAAFWPGPLTLIFNARPDAPCRGVDGSVALRCPDHPLTQALVRECAGLMASTSANRAGEPVAASGAEAARIFGLGEAGLALAFEAPAGAPQSAGIASTLVDCRGVRPVLIRQGAVTLQGVEGP